MSGQHPDESRMTLILGSQPFPQGKGQEQDTHHGA